MRYIQSLALLLVTGLLVSCSPQNQSVDLVRTAIVNTTVIDVVNGVRQNQTIVFLLGPIYIIKRHADL